MSEKIVTGIDKDPFDLFRMCEKEATHIELQFDKDGNILAPNGRISAYNQFRSNNEARDLSDPAVLLAAVVRTPAFLRKFGDWTQSLRRATKLVYESTGEPMLVFHGTNYRFYERPRGQDVQPVMQSTGHSDIMNIAWFTSDPDAALHFSRTSRIVNTTAGVECWEEPGFVFPALLRITKPQYFESNEKMKDKIYRSLPGIVAPKIREWLLYPRMYDGIIQTKGDVELRDFEHEADQCGVFDADQIFQLPFNIGESGPKKSIPPKLVWG